MSALVILVDTDRRVLRLTEALLSREGCLVAALSSFEEATHILDSVMPDLLIAGCGLDHAGGLRLAIRNHHFHPQVPVIVTTSHHDPRVEDEATRCGAAY